MAFDADQAEYLQLVEQQRKNVANHENLLREMEYFLPKGARKEKTVSKFLILIFPTHRPMLVPERRVKSICGIPDGVSITFLDDTLIGCSTLEAYEDLAQACCRLEHINKNFPARK